MWSTARVSGYSSNGEHMSVLVPVWLSECFLLCLWLSYEWAFWVWYTHKQGWGGCPGRRPSPEQARGAFPIPRGAHLGTACHLSVFTVPTGFFIWVKIYPSQYTISLLLKKSFIKYKSFYLYFNLICLYTVIFTCSSALRLDGDSWVGWVYFNLCSYNIMDSTHYTVHAYI